MDFYHNVFFFTGGDRGDIARLGELIPTLVSIDDNENLISIPGSSEIRGTIFKMDLS